MDELSLKSISTFKQNINASIRKFWAGNGDIYDFFEDVDRAIRVGYEQAWAEGASTCGIKPDERTIEEAQRLEELITQNRQYIFSFGESIEEDSKANGGLLAPQLSRGEMWINRYVETRSIATSMACGDIKLKWVWSPQKEHCTDCFNMNGRVYRASVWAKYNIFPRSPQLACFGGHCGCDFKPTDERVTPGRPPGLVGKELIEYVPFELIYLDNGFVELRLI